MIYLDLQCFISLLKLIELTHFVWEMSKLTRYEVVNSPYKEHLMLELRKLVHSSNRKIIKTN